MDGGTIADVEARPSKRAMTRSIDSLPSPTASAVANPEALKVLLDASAMLLASASADAVLSGILDLAGQVIAADATRCGAHARAD